MARLAILLAIGSRVCSADEYCLTHGMNDTCYTCAASFLNEKGACEVPAKGIEHCFKYDSAGSCESCIVGFKFDGAGCKKLDEDDLCVMYEGEKCVMCRKDVTLRGSVCDDSEKCDIANCEYCIDAELMGKICYLCAKGHVLSIGTETFKFECIPETPETHNGRMSTDIDDGSMRRINNCHEGKTCKQSTKYHFDIDWKLQMVESALL